MSKKMLFMLGCGMLGFLLGFYILSLLPMGESGKTVFAEGYTECKGRIVGVTQANPANVNAGVTSFNAHKGEGAEDNSVTNLNIVGKAQGLAPQSKDYAGCVMAEDNKLKLKGFAWNTNGGFISLSCVNGFNYAGIGVGVACGANDYETVWDKAGGKFTGYAWSPTFGYIKWSGSTKNFDYGVTINKDGNTSGYAWSQAGIYLNFAGLKLYTPDDKEEKVPVVNDGDCKNPKGVCVTIDPAPYALKVDGTAEMGPKIADGKDAYKVHLYLSTDDGVPIDVPNEWLGQDIACQEPGDKGGGLPQELIGLLPFASADLLAVMFIENVVPVKVVPPQPNFQNLQNFLACMTFDWKDTVKLDQTAGNTVGNTLNEIKSPFVQGTGGVNGKPIVFLRDFTEVEAGHYVSGNITSVTPTDESNISMTTKQAPYEPFLNTQWVNTVPEIQGQDIEPNVLILKNISNIDLKKVDGSTAIAEKVNYPNNKQGMVLKYKPAFQVKTLYAGLFDDKIVAYRSIPIAFSIAFDILGQPAQGSIDTASAKLKLSFDPVATAAQNGCQNANVVKDFDFVYIKDGKIDAMLNADATELNASISKNLGKTIVAGAWALLPEIDAEGGELPCDYAQAPSLYSVVSYECGANACKYYHNKLPREAGDQLFNLAVIIKGNVLGTLTNTQVSSKIEIQNIGASEKQDLRDSIAKNISKSITATVPSTGVCTVTELAEADVVAACKGGASYKVVDVGSEKVFYSSGNISIDLANGKLKGKWGFVSGGANIFIDSDMYADPATYELEADKPYAWLVALSAGDFDTGNIYMGPCEAGIRNVDAWIIAADGSFFVYDGVKGNIDKSGVPQYPGGFSEFIEKNNCQTLVRGTVKAWDTVGGADADRGIDPKPYLYDGLGNTLDPAKPENREKAIKYDLNFMRTLKAGTEVEQVGNEFCTVDQKCGKALCLADLQAIAGGQTLCGEKGDCDPNAPANNQAYACDGINPLKIYSSSVVDQMGPDGDLIPPADQSLLSKELDHSKDFNSFYIWYEAPPSDSLILNKVGAAGSS
ncbi:hypothetical protein HY605_05440 [Candidatus Peregrinibacteria bacterium]|nr:hypothetical protein [Candidatus Peregrinibacteria bacterium]